MENCVGEQIVDSPLPQIMEAVWPSTPRDPVQNRTPEQLVDVPSASDYGGIIAGIKRVFPQERVQYRFPESIVDVLVPQIKQDGLPYRIPPKRAV